MKKKSMVYFCFFI